jgi:hypothetical protein
MGIFGILGPKTVRRTWLPRRRNEVHFIALLWPRLAVLPLALAKTSNTSRHDCGVASAPLTCDPRRPKYFRNSADDPTYLLWQELLCKWLRTLVGFGAARKTCQIAQGLGSPLRQLA